MLLPLLLIGLATSAAAILAYGTHPSLADGARGLSTIMLTRRLEWPLITFALLMCIALLGLVIANKRRVWWLIGLAPVLALFVHRFVPQGDQRLFILDNPQFIPAAEATIPDDAWVVGITFEDHAYALPYSVLYRTPVVFITDYDKRLVVLWSARANRAMPVRVTREFKARDLEFTTTPADTVLLFDRRLGQFIVSLTGRTVDGERPVGFQSSVPVMKTTWSVWRKLHPETRLLRAWEASDAPTGPILPTESGMLVNGVPAEARVALIGTDPPHAVLSDSVGAEPMNLSAGATRVLLLRDPITRRIRAFDRNVKEDLFPTFSIHTNRQTPEVAMIDSDSRSSWTIAGQAIAGPLKGEQLKELPVEDNLYWGPMKHWYPDLTLTN